jgi:gluconate 2-dehydrogenase gamma chain
MLRRKFLSRTGAALGGYWATLGTPAILATAGVAARAAEARSAFRVLSPAEAADFQAITAQIIPSGETPGAREAGVIYFMDTLLADTRPELLPALRAGLQSLNSSVRETYDEPSFAELGQEQQIEALQAIEDSEFFDAVRFLTIAGTFSDPVHGGNRNRAGWDLIGFGGPVGTQPPFGYYDADYAKKGE